MKVSVLFILAVFFPGVVLAADVKPVAEAGIFFHSGTTGKSLTGAASTFFAFRAEDKKGFFRLQAAAELQFGSGTASVGETAPSFSLFQTSFLGGVHFFPFQDGVFLPFVGGSGIVGWSYLELTGQASDTEPQTQAIIFGYETSAGVDIKAGGDRSYRIRGSYWQVTGGLAGISGFQLSGFRISIGYAF